LVKVLVVNLPIVIIILTRFFFVKLNWN
jgi:hypothetical protein